MGVELAMKHVHEESDLRYIGWLWSRPEALSCGEVPVGAVLTRRR